MDPSQQNICTINNLTLLTPVSEESAIKCLCKRYKSDKFYTNAGSTLIAINPFRTIPHIYSVDVIEQHNTHRLDDLSPHVFLLSQKAFLGLRNDVTRQNQSVIISGESGAGKTVTAKLVMKYLTSVAGDKDSAVDDLTGAKIERRILDSNPVLEAFGNAVTARNDNSSRFGKYIKLQFNRSSAIIGSHIQTYLLEKTRVVHQNHRESNFHVFYQMLQGASTAERQTWLLSDLKASDFVNLNNAIRQNIHDENAWKELTDALTEIGVTFVQQQNIFKILSSVLHMGNLAFVVDEDDDSCSLPSGHSVKRSLDFACRLLGLDSDKLERVLTFREITASHSRRKSVFHKACSLDESNCRRDCLSKLLYQKLFDWLVELINSVIKSDHVCNFIGILDIYGFESFIENSLEQLCINYANEKLQQHFVAQFLKELQEEYISEAMPWTYTEFSDNSLCLDILEGQISVLSLINEECFLNRPSNDKALLERLDGNLNQNKHFKCPRNGNCCFIIKHYAGDVRYRLAGLVEKNKDDIPNELTNLLKGSNNEFVRQLFSNSDTETTSRKKKTVFSKFKTSLDALMATLKGTDTFYVRCIKPNRESLPGSFDNLYVLDQMRACGVMETVEICRQGYPARLPYTEFLQRYGVLLREHQSVRHTDSKITTPSLPAPGARTASDHSDDNKENEALIEPLDVLYSKQFDINTTPRKSMTPKRRLRRRAAVSSADHTRKCCATVMKYVFGRQYLASHNLTHQFGKTKIYLRDGQLEALESSRNTTLSKFVFTIQCAWRRKLRWRKRKQKAVVKIQSVVRCWLVRKRIRKLQEAASKIQSAYRTFKSKHNSGRSFLDFGDFKTDIADNFGFSVIPLDIDSSMQSTISSRESNSASNFSHRFSLDYTTIGSNTLRRGSFYQDIRLAVRAPIHQVLSEIAAGQRITYPHLTYLEVGNGIVTRRRLPRVPIKFHVKVNSVIKCGHYARTKEFACSLLDCLPDRIPSV